MKVLQFPVYVSINGDNEFSRNTTGYGYMTLDIATSTAQQGIEVDLLTQSNITNGKFYSGINILRRTWFDILFNMRFRHLFSAVNLIIKNKIALNRVPNIVLYNISMGYFEKILTKKKFDLVHIHGIEYSTIPIIEICKKFEVNYLITLHGLNSFSDSVNITSREKELEKEFIQDAFINNVPVSVISTGIRNTILRFLNKNDSKTFFLVPNGCDIVDKYIIKDFDIRERYKIPNSAKVMLCVGNIGVRKNQSQIIRSFQIFNKKYSNNLVLLFLGNDTTNGAFQKQLQSAKLNNQLIVCGNIPKKDLIYYYSQADYNIVASISEGFGLSIIEGFAFGLPTLAFSDIDAVDDLFNEDSMFLVKERSDKALAEGIHNLVRRNWDKNKIITHSKKFSLEEMAISYIRVYHKILS